MVAVLYETDHTWLEIIRWAPLVARTETLRLPVVAGESGEAVWGSQKGKQSPVSWSSGATSRKHCSEYTKGYQVSGDSCSSKTWATCFLINRVVFFFFFAYYPSVLLSVLDLVVSSFLFSPSPWPPSLALWFAFQLSGREFSEIGLAPSEKNFTSVHGKPNCLWLKQ